VIPPPPSNLKNLPPLVVPQLPPLPGRSALAPAIPGKLVRPLAQPLVFSPVGANCRLSLQVSVLKVSGGGAIQRVALKSSSKSPCLTAVSPDAAWVDVDLNRENNEFSMAVQANDEPVERQAVVSIIAGVQRFELLVVQAAGALPKRSPDGGNGNSSQVLGHRAVPMPRVTPEPASPAAPGSPLASMPKPVDVPLNEPEASAMPAIPPSGPQPVRAPEAPSLGPGIPEGVAHSPSDSAPLAGESAARAAEPLEAPGSKDEAPPSVPPDSPNTPQPVLAPATPIANPALPEVTEPPVMAHSPTDGQASERAESAYERGDPVRTPLIEGPSTVSNQAPPLPEAVLPSQGASEGQPPAAAQTSLAMPSEKTGPNVAEYDLIESEAK
jgi:hypothetical protein